MSFYNLPLSHIHLELTTKCNAACPMCLRNINGDVPNPNLELSDFDIKWLDNFDIPINKLTLCGNYGDPILYPNLFELIDKWLTIYDKPIKLMTNGGARNTDWWANLAKVGKGKLEVVFGIDGLEDTNHLYRRHVVWPKLINNVSAFINAGGNAKWKFIIFKHNQHQVDQAKALAESMKFKSFEQIITNRFSKPKLDVLDKDANVLYSLEEPVVDNRDFKAKNPNRILQTKEWTGEINCYAKKESSMYIAADGRVYPCCNLGYHFPHEGIPEVVHFQNSFNNFRIQDSKLSDIIDDKYFAEIESKWSSTPLRKCITTCGMMRDNLHKVENLNG